MSKQIRLFIPPNLTTILVLLVCIIGTVFMIIFDFPTGLAVFSGPYQVGALLFELIVFFASSDNYVIFSDRIVIRKMWIPQKAMFWTAINSVTYYAPGTVPLKRQKDTAAWLVITRDPCPTYIHSTKGPMEFLNNHLTHSCRIRIPKGMEQQVLDVIEDCVRENVLLTKIH